MPGIFGATGSHHRHLESLEKSFREIWGQVEVRRLSPAAGVGGHVFRGRLFHDASEGALTARDGELRAYAAETGSDEAFVGNQVTLDEDGLLELRADETGAFPLYYAGDEEGLAFSSLLRPLGRALAATPDQVAISQFLRTAYTCAGRSFFQGVSRLLPGQVLRWRPGEAPSIEESSQAWAEIAEHLKTPEEAAEEALPLLTEILERALDSGGSNVLMMSAGWDSRTLLAAALSTAAPLEAFSHGDLESREVRIARALSEAAGVPWRGRTIGPDVWDLDHLERTFSRTETLVFPHWSWAGRVNNHASSIFSGVLGEVLGGHYGSTQITGGAGKVAALLWGMRPGAGQEVATEEDVAALEQRFTPGQIGRLWYLREDVERDEGAKLKEALREGVGQDLQRLRKRGVNTRAQLTEGFVTEHRGVQYICAQALGSRMETDIAIPFGVTSFFRFASQVPPHLKIHNRVNRALAHLVAPDLLRLPMAATLAPASAPVLVQEASRLVRKIYEKGRQKATALSGGRLSASRLSWVNFRFLREGDTVDQVLDSLDADLWDRKSLDAHSSGVRLHPLFDQMGKVLTVDRAISG